MTRFVSNSIGTDATGTVAQGGGDRIHLAGGPRLKTINIDDFNLEALIHQINLPW